MATSIAADSRAKLGIGEYRLNSQSGRNQMALVEVTSTSRSVVPLTPDQLETISDRRFIENLTQVYKVKQFLFEEKIRLEKKDLSDIDLEELNNLHYSSAGRTPTVKEWCKLDEKFVNISSHLTDEMRRKLRLYELGMFFKTFPVIFLAISIISVNGAVMLPSLIPDINSLFRFLLWQLYLSAWLLSQGGLGACAFVGTSMIVKTIPKKNSYPSSNIQEIIDVTDKNFLTSRILLGALFAAIIGLPFVSKSMHSITNLFYHDQDKLDPTSLPYILLPFIAGFSINLVLTILGRFVLAIEAFFGGSARS
jgi:hypothetical protein